MKPLVAGIIGMALLAGCAQVPTSGPVVEVDQAVPDVASTSFVRALAVRPGRHVPDGDRAGFPMPPRGSRTGMQAVVPDPAAARQWDPMPGRVYGNGTETLTATTQTEVTFAATRSRPSPIVPSTSLPPDTAR